MDQVYQNWDNLTASEQADFLANYPGILPPEGVVSNFDNPPTRNDIGLSVITIFLVLVVITGSLRLYSRIAVVRVFKLEDCESPLMVEPCPAGRDLTAYLSTVRPWVRLICT